MKMPALTFAALLLPAAVAVAADLPSSQNVLPAPVPAAPAWGGLHLGVNAGYLAPGLASRVQSEPYFVAAAPFAALAAGPARVTDADGVLGGAQAGFAWRLASRFILGIEADIQGVSGGGGRGVLATLGAVDSQQAGAAVVSTALGLDASLDYLATARARLGWLATPTLLVYGSGGAAFGKVHIRMAVLQDDSSGFPGLGGSAFSGDLTGWAAGSGVEWMFSPNWSAKAEYLHYDLGQARLLAALSPVGLLAPYVGVQSRTDFAGNLGRVGLNYHFSWRGGGPSLLLR